MLEHARSEASRRREIVENARFEASVTSKIVDGVERAVKKTIEELASKQLCSKTLSSVHFMHGSTVVFFEIFENENVDQRQNQAPLLSTAESGV